MVSAHGVIMSAVVCVASQARLGSTAWWRPDARLVLRLGGVAWPVTMVHHLTHGSLNYAILSAPLLAAAANPDSALLSSPPIVIVTPGSVASVGPCPLDLRSRHC